MLEKAYIVMNEPLEWIWRGLRRRRELYRKYQSLREYLNGHEQNVGRNTDCKGHLDEVSDRNETLEEKGDLCYRVANILVESCLRPGVLWQVELVINENEYLVEAISKQSIKGATWLPLNAHHKMQEKRKDLKTIKPTNSQRSRLKNWENSLPIHISKIWETCSEVNTKGVCPWKLL